MLTQKRNGRLLRRRRASEFFEKEGVTDDEIAYGLRLLMDRSFVIGSYDKTSGTFDIERLSMDGHDFLDSIRDPDVWDKTKKRGIGRWWVRYGSAQEARHWIRQKEDRG